MSARPQSAHDARAMLAFALTSIAFGATLAFVPPPYNGAALGGTYVVTGTEPDGKEAPAGLATILHLGGGRYRMTEEVAGATYVAACLRAHDVFACGWGAKGRTKGIAIYERTSDGMSGTWWEDDEAGVGRERLVGGAADLSGYFTIAKGERPDGSAYTGYVTSDLFAGVYHLAFHSATTAPGHRYGFGLREGDLLTVGYDATSTCGVVTYRILGGGAGLTGRWVDPSRPNGTGTETLTRN